MQSKADGGAASSLATAAQRGRPSRGGRVAERAKRIPVGSTESEGGAAPQRLRIDGLHRFSPPVHVYIVEASSAEEPPSPECIVTRVYQLEVTSCL